jgi:hypothetical protein
MTFLITDIDNDTLQLGNFETCEYTIPQEATEDEANKALKQNSWFYLQLEVPPCTSMFPQCFEGKARWVSFGMDTGPGLGLMWRRLIV